MMSDGPFRSQLPPQQSAQIPGQFVQQQQPQNPAQFPLQAQQLLAGGPPPQQPLAMQSQPPYGAMQGLQQQQQLHPSAAGGPGLGPVGPVSTNLPPSAQPSGPGGAGGGVGGPSAGGAGQQATGDGNVFQPVVRAKALVVDLKQALQTLMKTAADVTKEQALTDTASSGDTPAPVPTLDSEELRRSLEVFDSVCDQIETNFMMLQDLHREQAASDRYTPANVLPGGQKSDDQLQQADIVPGRPILTYKEYDDLTRVQSQFGTSIRESFAECSRILDQL